MRNQADNIVIPFKDSFVFILNFKYLDELFLALEAKTYLIYIGLEYSSQRTLVIRFEHFFDFVYSSIFEFLYAYDINFLHCFPKLHHSCYTTICCAPPLTT
jgi:hypothetical protein